MEGPTPSSQEAETPRAVEDPAPRSPEPETPPGVVAAPQQPSRCSPCRLPPPVASQREGHQELETPSAVGDPTPSSQETETPLAVEDPAPSSQEPETPPGVVAAPQQPSRCSPCRLPPACGLAAGGTTELPAPRGSPPSQELETPPAVGYPTPRSQERIQPTTQERAVARESNPGPFSPQADALSTEPHQPGLIHGLSTSVP
uniref:Uncharacterized protein n=1 Tax=Myotis myotis TaxID=51298 RepID=A0A7J7QV76_MYOMY|nr:hypothetical protein mMyoMyo1_011548 [Myotis myotis]